MMLIGMGAEAKVVLEGERVIKKRISKRYRIPQLDSSLRKERTRAEAKLTSAARKLGIPTPIIYGIGDYHIEFEYLDGPLLRDCIDEELSREAGRLTAKLHMGGIVHGDLTTSNFILSRGRLFLIDFGLSSFDSTLEGFGMDVHLYIQSVRATHVREELVDAFKDGYSSEFSKAEQVFERVREIERRRRYL
jgi:TP53 regulating kinase-like protein